MFYYRDQNTVKILTVSVFVCLFCCFTSQVNSYGHGGTVISPNHVFFLGKLEQAVNQYFVHILQPFLNDSAEGRRLIEKLFHGQSPRKYGTGPGLTSGPLDLPDMLPTALHGPVQCQSVRNMSGWLLIERP